MAEDAAFPTTPAGAHARWYVDRIRTLGAAVTEDEVAEHVALAPPWLPIRTIEQFMRSDPRPFTVSEVKTPTPDEVHVIFDYGDDKPFRLSLSFDANAPNRIVRSWWARNLPDDIVVRLANDGDAAALNDLEVRAPMTLAGDITLIYDRGPDFLAFSRLMDENVAFVADRDGELLGVACGAAHDVRIGGSTHRVMLLHHLRVPSEHRKLGVFSTLNGYVFGHYEGRTDGAYGYTALDNAEAMRISGPGTWDAGVFRAVLETETVAATAAGDGRGGRPATAADAAAIVDILNRCHDREEVYLPHTVASLTERLARDPSLYDWSRLRLVDGAVLGVWPAELRVTRIAGDGVRLESVRAVALDHAFVPGAEDAFEALVAAACAELLEQGHSELTFVTSTGSPAYPFLARVAHQMDPFAFRMAIPEPEGTVDRGVYVDTVYF